MCVVTHKKIGYITRQSKPPITFLGITIWVVPYPASRVIILQTVGCKGLRPFLLIIIRWFQSFLFFIFIFLEIFLSFFQEYLFLTCEQNKYYIKQQNILYTCQSYNRLFLLNE